MEKIELSKRQMPLKDAFEGKHVDDVRQHTWNVGTGMEDPIFYNIPITPTAVSEILFKWLEKEQKVIFPWGIESKENVCLNRLKPQTLKAAAEHLDDEVLLPNGDTVSIEKVNIEE